MKLYVWHRLESIAQYGPGMAYAHAETVEEARGLILGCNPITFGRTLKELEEELLELEPTVYEGSMGVWEWGSA